MRAPIPENEAQRLAALMALDLLDSDDEAFFDEIVGLASDICEAPIALVTLVAETRQWFKAKRGVEFRETCRDDAFCAHAILRTEPLVVSDATKDPRFADNPFVVGDTGVRAYAGFPLLTQDGFALGTLCAIRTEASAWTSEQLDRLGALARMTMRHIELRKAEREAAWLREVRDRLADTETRFTTIVANMSEGVVIQNAEGAITWANKAAEEILGLSFDEMSGRTSMDPRWRAMREDGSELPGEEHYPMIALRTGQRASGILSLEQPSKRRRWLNVSSQPILGLDGTGAVQVVSTFLDITEERRNQIRLSENEARLTLALDLAKAVTWDIDVERGFVFLSETLTSFFGRDITEDALNDFWGLIYEEDRAAVQEAWVAHLKGGPPLNMDHRVTGANGEPVWVRANAIAQRPHNAKAFSRFTGMFQDISIAKKQEQELAAALERAEAASTAKSAFLANMSHEIRTPLNGVIGLAGALAGTELSAKQKEMVGLIENSGRVLERLLSDILDVSKVEAGRFELEVEPFDLHEEVEAAAHVMRIRAEEKGIGFAIRYGENARGTFNGDAVRLKQVVSNLVSNAIKFTEEGDVSVSVDLDTRGEDAANWLVLCVRDTGIGFDEDAAATLFQRFSQADTSITRRFGGTGLGLAICKAIADLMGGAIKAESEPGKGTTFTFEVPLPRAESLDAYDLRRRAPAVAPDHPVVGTNESLRILVAEDHATNQLVIEMLLEPMGASLTLVENGEECVRAYKAGAYDLILMDMQMPVMDGIAATREIRRLEQETGRARTPIAMLSANVLSTHREMASRAGVDHYIAKPISPQGLFEGINATLEAGRGEAAAA